MEVEVEVVEVVEAEVEVKEVVAEVAPGATESGGATHRSPCS